MKMQLFETTDFYLACFLRCMGYDLAEVRRDGVRSVFVFHDKPGRRKDVMSFYNNQTVVRPLTFVGTIKDMKSLIHNT